MRVPNRSGLGSFLAGAGSEMALRRIEELRTTEYAYLDDGDHVYLDYTGAGLPATRQLYAHVKRVASGCFGNPHSDNPTSMASTVLVEQARQAVLRWFNTSADEYAVVFTPNATGACRLVGEAYPFGPHRRLVLTADNHNSVNGLRRFARSRGGAVCYIPLSTPELRVAEENLASTLGGPRKGLFAYPAQSNFTGVRHPLSWVARAQEAGYDVLLDAAAFVPSCRLHLGVIKPEFVAMSWYKVFGYPTGVGCLLARRDAFARLRRRRPWFSGGTIMAVSVQGNWHKLAEDEAAFEDGTLNFLAIPDVTEGLAWMDSIGMDAVSEHVERLTGRLLHGLIDLKHTNGSPMARIYGPRDTIGRGGTVALNFLDPSGALVDERAVARDSSAAGISVRTGCFCNPGAGEWAFGLSRRNVRGGWWRGFARQGSRTVDDYLRMIGLPVGGAVRVSVGLPSNMADIERFLDFAERTYRDRPVSRAGLSPRLHC
ncbi:aminotransferase class V-fold PLP-dependent enzyme [Mycobacterium heidelbergense]|uniref:aminotransferase class V-fold PLP-dependent enzyme n=1 Tax=Mycobacterium heidelbergense TaxID=53376 RepID=UPI003CFBB713